ncbi:unnamed protein product [Vicia faba]|uniref:Uncharacterized protein n=1 Tax=Vicia faba TaxID=3906 RepID=A0AAV0YF54_VICFA|nr:unnamed protein product [Vicia faba]
MIHPVVLANVSPRMAINEIQVSKSNQFLLKTSATVPDQLYFPPNTIISNFEMEVDLTSFGKHNRDEDDSIRSNIVLDALIPNTKPYEPGLPKPLLIAITMIPIRYFSSSLFSNLVFTDLTLLTSFEFKKLNLNFVNLPLTTTMVFDHELNHLKLTVVEFYNFGFSIVALHLFVKMHSSVLQSHERLRNFTRNLSPPSLETLSLIIMHTESEVEVGRVFMGAGCNHIVNNISWGASGLVSLILKMP